MSSSLTKLRVLVVDDEPLAREGVRLLLAKEAGIEVIGECSTGKQAIKAIESEKPDLVFLDIKMPNISGFDVIEAIDSENMPLMVFLTAYGEYAINAFKVEAIDYLLKPVDDQELSNSLARARTAIRQKQLAFHAEQLQQLSHSHSSHEKTPAATFISRLNGKIFLVSAREVHCVQADGDYVTLFTCDKQYLVRETMKNVEAKLDTQHYLRIHRSVIVKLSEISHLTTDDNGEYHTALRSGQVFKVSRTYRDRLLAKLGAI